MRSKDGIGHTTNPYLKVDIKFPTGILLLAIGSNGSWVAELNLRKHQGVV